MGALAFYCGLLAIPDIVAQVHLPLNTRCFSASAPFVQPTRLAFLLCREWLKGGSREQKQPSKEPEVSKEIPLVDLQKQKERSLPQKEERHRQHVDVHKRKAEPAIEHELNNIVVEQRITDGFINGTAMCVAHCKDITDWLRTDGTWDLVTALANDLEMQRVEIKTGKIRNSVFTRVSATYPDLVVSKRGSPENGGGVWLHPDLAIQLAQWCNPFFAIQVSRWVREWIITAEEQRFCRKKSRRC